MRISFFLASLVIVFSSYSQTIDSLDTARHCLYMTAEEREMIYEINRLRTNPKSFIEYVQPLLHEATTRLDKYGKGSRSYSLTFTTSIKNGKQIETFDTTWHYRNVEEVEALTTLINHLKKSGSLSMLKPDSGIYNAVRKHAKDQNDHEWKLMHTGTDGSQPWDRITEFSPAMVFGNENIAGTSKNPVTARDIIIQLLIDSGIPGYGHRHNLLDPGWTHVACKGETYGAMHWWIQNFGQRKRN